MEDIRFQYKIWLSGSGLKSIYGDGKHRLLGAIETFGSLSEAARHLKISYRKAWGDIKKAEEGLGFALLEKERGGRSGGRSRLTSKGKKLLENYEVLRDDLEELFRSKTNSFIKSLEQ